MSKAAKSSVTQASELESHIGFWMRFVSNHVSARFKHLVEAQGVTVSEWVALRALYGEAHVSHAGLVETLGMTRGAASKIISKLVEKNLVERDLAEGSAKVQMLTLSKPGRALVPRLAALADENDAHFFGHLDADSQAQLSALLQAVVREHGLKQLPLE